MRTMLHLHDHQLDEITLSVIHVIKNKQKQIYLNKNKAIGLHQIHIAGTIS